VVGTLLILGYLIKSFSMWLVTNTNVMITMLLGGLWHGASWNFIIWGGLNGIGLVFYKLWKKISPWEKGKSKWYGRAWGILLTFHFITLTRVWFRAGSGTTWEDFEAVHDLDSEQDTATLILKKVAQTDWTLAGDVIAGYWAVFSVMLAGFVIHWLPSSLKERYRKAFAALPYWAIILCILLTVVLIYQILIADLHPFIYFQF
jgi:D-alanyl-lipoteichoic acid acyltransferase DltB (MBOAT superfamily)